MLRQLIEENVNAHREAILSAEQYLWTHAETGFREWESTAYMEKCFTDLGYTLTKAGNIPGFYADLDTGRPGPTVALMAELDALLLSSHPQHNPKTQAAHACGHHAQCAYLVGCAAALKDERILSQLCGRIRLMAVPAEELIELAYREELRKQGIIHYFGGKVEFLYRGFFDGVDMAAMLHAANGYGVGPGDNGCITKKVIFHGKAAHAAGGPQVAINALYAANLGMQAINALRETFYEQDYTRVHPIITAGGQTVNIIPDEVVLESYVRGSKVEAIKRVNDKVNRAMAASAAAMGATVTIFDRPGYMPNHNDKRMMDMIAEEMADVLGGEAKDYISDGWSTGSTDVGDLSCVMPVVQGYGGGAIGHGHGVDYEIADKELACVSGTKVMCGLMCHLLKDNATAAREVIANKQPICETYEEYFRMVDAFYADIEGVEYQEDGSVKLSIR